MKYLSITNKENVQINISDIAIISLANSIIVEKPFIKETFSQEELIQKVLNWTTKRYIEVNIQDDHLEIECFITFKNKSDIQNKINNLIKEIKDALLNLLEISDATVRINAFI